MADKAHTRWRGSTDGTPWMQRTLVRLLRFMPLPLTYGLMAAVIPFYVLFDRPERKASYLFFHNRIGYSPLRSSLAVFRNMYNLGKVVVDRFAAYGGKRFNMVSDNLQVFDSLASAPDAFMMLSAHVGNFEMVGYMLPSQRPNKVLVYGGETATVMENRQRLFSGTQVEMVPVQEDLSHLFILNNALSKGEIVTIPADRSLGSRKSFRLPFLGAEASFPSGPFILAAQREVPVLAVFVVKEKRQSYRVVLERLPMPEDGKPDQRARELAKAYANVLERVVRQWPEQWYNFYDFWAE